MLPALATASAADRHHFARPGAAKPARLGLVRGLPRRERHRDRARHSASGRAGARLSRGGVAPVPQRRATRARRCARQQARCPTPTSTRWPRGTPRSRAMPERRHEGVAMRIIGKLIGALIGLFLFRNPFGLLIGAMVGHFFDVAADAAQAAVDGQRLHRAAVRLRRRAVQVGRARVRSRDRRDRIADARACASTAHSGARRSSSFNVGKQADFPVEQSITDLKRWCGGRRDLAFLVLDLLLDLVYAEGALVGAEARAACASSAGRSASTITNSRRCRR